MRLFAVDPIEPFDYDKACTLCQMASSELNDGWPDDEHLDNVGGVLTCTKCGSRWKYRYPCKQVGLLLCVLGIALLVIHIFGGT